MSFEGCSYIFLVQLSTGVLRACIVLIMYFVTCIYMHVDAHFLDNVVSFVRTWMRFMVCSMLMLHIDESSLGC